MESPLMLLDLTARQAHCIIECNEVVLRCRSIAHGFLRQLPVSLHRSVCSVKLMS